MTAGGKKSKRRRQQANRNLPDLPAEKSGPSSDSTGTKPEEPLSPLNRILALDDMQFMKTCSDARYLRTFGFLCYLLAMLCFVLLAMMIYKEPPPNHPFHGVPFSMITLNTVFFLSFGILFRNLRCRAARILMKTFSVICLIIFGLWLIFAVLEAVLVDSDLTAIAITGGFLLVFYFIFRALGNPLLFGSVTVTYRQLTMIRRKKLQGEKIVLSELPQCRTAGKFDFTVVVIAWISLVLMFAAMFSGVFTRALAPGMADAKPAQSAPVQTAPAPASAPAASPIPAASARTVPPPAQKPNR